MWMLLPGAYSYDSLYNPNQAQICISLPWTSIGRFPWAELCSLAWLEGGEVSGRQQPAVVVVGVKSGVLASSGLKV